VYSSLLSHKYNHVITTVYLTNRL